MSRSSISSSLLRRSVLTAAVASVSLASGAFGQEYWTNTTVGSYSLSTNTNWESGNTLTSSATDLRFFITSVGSDLSLLGAYTISNDVTGLALSRLDLDGQSTATGRSVTLSGNAITLSSGATLNLGNQASSGGNAFGYTISAPTTIGGALTVNGSPVNPGGVTFSAVTLPSTASTFTVGSNNRVSFNGVTFDADHSFAGAGTGGITFGGTVTLLGNRVFNVTGSALPTLGGTITDVGSNYSITKTGAGTLTISAANHTIGGGITVQAGTLVLSAGAGTITHTAAGVTVQNGSTVNLDWIGTPSGPVVATNLGYGSGGGVLGFGTSSGNPVNLSYSGAISGSGALRVLARGGKDSITFSADNSGYTGGVTIENSSPTSFDQLQAVLFANAAARFGSASNAIIAVRSGGRVGFNAIVATAELSAFSFGNFGGVQLVGSNGAFASSLSDPFSLLQPGGGIVLNNRDSLNNNRWDNAAAVSPNSQVLHIIGRNLDDTPVSESVGDMTINGGSVLVIDRPSIDTTGTGSGVRVTATSLSAPAAGSSLLIRSANIGDPSGAGVNALIVTGSKPAVTNGMISPGIQHYTGGNALANFVTFDANNNVVVATTTSTDITTAGATDIVNIGAAQTLTTTKNIHALRIGENLTLTGATLTVDSGGVIMSSRNISGTGTLDFASNPGFIGAYNASAQATISAKISGSGGLTVLGSSQTLNVTGSNDFTGGIFINGGSARFSTAGANGNNVTVNAFGRLVAGPAGTGTDRIGGLSGAGIVAAWVSGSGTSTGTLDISPASGTFTFDGSMSNGSSGRTLAVTKSGDGTQVFGSNSVGTYTGVTTVSKGKLVVNGNFSAATGNVSVNGADGSNLATLGGTGTLGGAVTVGQYGVLAPGNSIGTLTVGDLTLASGSALSIDLNASPSSIAADTVVANSTTLGAGTANLVLVSTYVGSVPGTTLVIVQNATGTIDPASNYFAGYQPNSGDTFKAFSSGPLAGTIYYNYDTTTSSFTGGNDIAITFSSVPEPASLSLLALGALALRRRRVVGS